MTVLCRQVLTAHARLGANGSSYGSCDLGSVAHIVSCLVGLATWFADLAQAGAEPESDRPSPAELPHTSDAPEPRPPLSQVDDAETWFRELHPRLYAYVRYRITDVSQAEDLTSDIVERALTHFDSYDARKGAFSTWLFRIAHNTLVNYFRRRQRRGQYHVDLGEGLEDLATDTPSPEQAAIHKEEIARLLACVRTLSPRKQEILAMRFAGRLTNREIARVLHMNERTVSVTILRALRTLRKRLRAPGSVGGDPHISAHNATAPRSGTQQRAAQDAQDDSSP